jgi:hypothetical protein
MSPQLYFELWGLENVMTLKFMKKLGLKITRPYENTCSIDSRDIPVHGIIKDLEVSLEQFQNIFLYGCCSYRHT